MAHWSLDLYLVVETDSWVVLSLQYKVPWGDLLWFGGI